MPQPIVFKFNADQCMSCEQRLECPGGQFVDIPTSQQQELAADMISTALHGQTRVGVEDTDERCSIPYVHIALNKIMRETFQNRRVTRKKINALVPELIDAHLSTGNPFDSVSASQAAVEELIEAEAHHDLLDSLTETVDANDLSLVAEAIVTFYQKGECGALTAQEPADADKVTS